METDLLTLFPSHFSGSAPKDLVSTGTALSDDVDAFLALVEMRATLLLLRHRYLHLAAPSKLKKEKSSLISQFCRREARLFNGPSSPRDQKE
mmetsp:Transcript_39563/g.95583  ORF Transcript_39563/g.95583 Transcript_39563/m.95583 type:complete len:92 (-) Transcript_39563:451-726(-)